MLPLTSSEKFFYGIGAVAFGVKDCGFSYWLLIFYNQALGLSTERASLALFIALIFDAFVDIAIGHFSDNLRTRWGRRHPLMYASAVPVALLHAALWNPPASLKGSEPRLFAYLTTMAVLVRFAVSLNEIPQIALVAELTTSYDVRTSILSMRFFFGWAGGLSMAVLLQAALLHPSAEGARDAFFDREGFGHFGQLGSALMLLAILASAAGIHHRIPQLRSLEPARDTRCARDRSAPAIAERGCSVSQGPARSIESPHAGCASVPTVLLAGRSCGRGVARWRRRWPTALSALSSAPLSSSACPPDSRPTCGACRAPEQTRLGSLLLSTPTPLHLSRHL